MSLVNQRFMLKGQLEAVEQAIKDAAKQSGSVHQRFSVHPYSGDPTKVVFTTTREDHGRSNSIILNVNEAADLIELLQKVFGLGPVEDVE